MRATTPKSLQYFLIRASFALITVLALVMWIPSLAISAHLDHKTCEQRTIKDYERALIHMPSDRSPRGVRFRPQDIELMELSDEHVFVAGSPFGYRVATHRGVLPNDQLRNPVTLRWDLSVSLHSVDRRGHIIASVINNRTHLDVLHSPERQFLVSGEPGLYRLSITIRNRKGRRLGFFYRYVRIVSKRIQVGVVANRDSFDPGETLIGRIENRGTVTVLTSDGWGLGIERLAEDGWKQVLPDTWGGTPGSVEVFLSGGRAGRCLFFVVPLDASPGSYRMHGIVRPLGGGIVRQVTHYFTVSE